MGTSSGENISDQEKMRIVSNYILLAPPGEINEIFNDIRVLLKNDDLLKVCVSGALAHYNKEQFTPAELVGFKHVLITEFNDLGNGRFFDPRSRQAFKFDHLKKEILDCQPWQPDRTSEPWRAALEVEIDAYVARHYNHGSYGVFGKKSSDGITLTVCIESHDFQPGKFWNGRWRSEWSVTFRIGVFAPLRGLLKVQVHYYEDGNVQLVSSKDIHEILTITDEVQTAKKFVQIVDKAEEEYQLALTDNYFRMSNTTFKAIRRILPVTRAKFDWDKIASYTVGKELKNIN